MHNIVKEAHGKLIEISKNKKQYATLLTDLTVQVSTARTSCYFFAVACLLRRVVRCLLTTMCIMHTS